MRTNHFDSVIIGGGPAGSAAAISLAKAGKQVALVDKSRFPRDKICGDAISLDVIKQLYQLDPDLAQEFNCQAYKNPSYGVSLFAPNEKELAIPFYYQGERTPGYLAKRYDFDNTLFQFADAYANVTTFEGAPVKALAYADQGVEINLPQTVLYSPQVIGADGAHSVVNRQLGHLKSDKRFTSAGLRVYYANVKGFHQDQNVELHFFKETLPGYLWVFPLPDNQANVGIGILSSSVSKRKINLKQCLEKLLTKASLKERFKDAYPLESTKGMTLPLGGKKRNVSGDHFLLTGDAAGFIDPFTGEGIGNAIRSGRLAAQHTLNSFASNRFDAAFNAGYDKDYYHKMQSEFQISRTIQNLSRYPGLFNFVVNRTQRHPRAMNLLIKGLEDPNYLKALVQPSFYLRLLR